MVQKNKVTLEDISRKINISRTTIYKILNNKGKVSEETRRIVLETVREMNYVPNQAAKNLALNKQYNIAFSGFNSPQTPYTLNNLLKGTDWAAEEFKDYGLNLIYSLIDRGNRGEQIREIYKLAESGVDGFAIFPSQVEPMKKCINDLVDMGKYVVTVNKDVPDCRRHLYVGCDYYKSGILAAEVLARMIPPGQEIAVFLGGEGIEHMDITERYRGLTKKIGRFPSIKLLPPFKYDGNDPDKIKHFLTALLSENQNLGGIFDLTYELDLISRIVNKYNNKVRLVGFDLCDSVKNHMISHSIDAVVFQDMPAQGYLAVKHLYQFLSDSATAEIREESTKLEVVYEGNLEFYI
ncbi:MAG: substrate-binding domain-containing protein [Spirochaetales bacterium]|nr:substrate-binding domain-containing protein [Spirochaetales bacterium]